MELSAAERDYAVWLARIESRAIIPTKLGMLAVALGYWLWARDFEPPPTAVFGLFLVHGMATLAVAALLWVDKVATAQMRGLARVSYIADLVFVTGLVWLDARIPAPPTLAGTAGGEYHLLFLLLVIRGFALFRTTVENLAMALLVTAIFAMSLFWRDAPDGDLAEAAYVARAGFVWGLTLLAVVIVNLVGKQQQEVLRARERIAKAENLAALGEMAAGVAHEINNPIGIIKTYAEYLEKAAPADSPNLEDFSAIRKEAERCQGIVERMMDFARPKISEMKPFLLQDVAREVFEFVFPRGRQGKVSANFRVEDIPPPVRGDAAQIKQAILNVVVNARQILESVEKGGTVDIEVKRLAGPRAPVQVVVHDTGPGIGPEDAEKAFEPFFTRRHGGTGLGLAITRRIVEAHGGTIDIWPAANGGTTCAISLPVAEG